MALTLASHHASGSSTLHPMRGRRVLQGVALQHAHVVPIEVQHTRTETLQDEAWRSLMLQICPTLAPMGPWQESSKKPRVRWSLRTAISVFPPNRLVFFLILIRLRLARINLHVRTPGSPCRTHLMRPPYVPLITRQLPSWPQPLPREVFSCRALSSECRFGRFRSGSVFSEKMIEAGGQLWQGDEGDG